MIPRRGARAARSSIIAWLALASAIGEAAPEVIAHRGASGYLPEHTLAAYALAYGQGASWIEPDLVMTRDGVLIALHDVTLDATTDVAERFPERARADGHHYALDFDADEIAALRVIERAENRYPRKWRPFRVSRFEDVLALVLGANAASGCRVGVYPEIKASGFHHAAGRDPERALLEVLGRHGLDGPDAPVRIQSFEPASLERLRRYGSRHYLALLIADGQPVDLQSIADIADAVAPAKSLIAQRPQLVNEAHSAGLEVHSWTFRADQIGPGFASFAAELDWAANAGIDAIFTDHPDRAVAQYRQPACAGAQKTRPLAKTLDEAKEKEKFELTGPLDGSILRRLGDG